MTINLAIGVTLCALTAALALQQLQIHYLRRRVNAWGHRRSNHPAGKRLRAVK